MNQKCRSELAAVLAKIRRQSPGATLLHHCLMPERRYPFSGRSSILFGATTQFQLTVKKPDQFRIAEPGNDPRL